MEIEGSLQSRSTGRRGALHAAERMTTTVYLLDKATESKLGLKEALDYPGTYFKTVWPDENMMASIQLLS